MMKLAKYKYITLVCTRLVVLAALLLAAGEGAAQGYYTLTNGNIWWLDNQPPREDDATNCYVRGWDKTRQWTAISELGTHSGATTTLVASQGTIYLALNIEYAEDGTPTATIVNRLVAEVEDFTDNGEYTNTTQGFSPYCVWYRTNSTGYYYQEWENPVNGRKYRYYLTCDADNNLYVFANPVGEQMTTVTYWYDWDFGAAMQYTVGTGNDNDVTEYHWISFDTTGHENAPLTGSWKISGDSYQRPDELIYNPYYEVASQNSNLYLGNVPNMTYYDNRVQKTTADADWRNIPAVMPAAVMPVKVVNIEREILSIEGGIHGFQYRYTDAGTSDMTEITGTPASSRPAIEMAYGKEIIAEPLITYSNAPTNTTVHMRVMPEYRKCIEETYRRGISLNYRNREVDEFNSAGVVDTDSYYYWPESYGGEWTKHNALPAVLNEQPTIDSVVPIVDPRSRRYLQVDVSLNNALNNYRLKVKYAQPSQTPCYAQAVAKVYYSNGTTQSDTMRLHLTFERDVVDAVPRHAPIIRGYVIGGGRVANVGYAEVEENGPGEEDDDLVLAGGNTHITVHSADSIYALYGGNDIAGWVEGEKGATIQLGTELTDEDHPVHIGYAYGGGCGFYQYSGLYDALAGTWGSTDTKVKGLGYGQYCFNGSVYDWKTGNELVHSGPFGYRPYQGEGDFAIEETGLGQDEDENKLKGSIPYIRTSHTTIGVSDRTDPFHYLHNDYVVIDSLFGGAENAYIGITAADGDVRNGVTLDINGGSIMAAFGGNNYGGSVANTSTVFVNVWNTKLTDEEDIENTYFSGYGRDFGIRHLFGGGNLVDGSFARVNIYGGMVDTVFLGGNRANVKQAIGTVECLRQYDESRNPILDRFGHNGHFIWTNPTTDTANNCRNTDVMEWEGDQGRYNVRCLFGGNNAAPMDDVALVQLHSGGICSVYGGGNAGDMTNDDALTSLPSLYQGLLTKAFAGWDGYVPNKVGSIVAALHDSKIICEYVYGGCRQANVKNSCGVYAAGGAFGYINGGCDVSGDVGSSVEPTVTNYRDPETNEIVSVGAAAGTYVVCDSNVVVFGDIYGGSDGYLHCNDGHGHYNDEDLYDTYSWTAYDEYHDHVGKLIPTHNNTNVYFKNGYVGGNIYSGGINANVGFPSDTWPIHYSTDPSWEDHSTFSPYGGANNGRAHTVISGGTIEGQVFGGGFMASVYGLGYLNIKGNAKINEVYAGNDVAGSIESFGAYSQPPSPANHTGVAESGFYNSMGESADEATNSQNRLNYRDGDNWKARYSTYVRVEGTPQINYLYGSGNGAWNYDGSRPQYEEISVCEAALEAGERPHQASAFIDINTSGGYIHEVFGGGNGAGVREDNLVILLNNTDTVNKNSPTALELGFDNSVKKNFVGTIFGGNNADDMTSCVPNIRLEKGSVKNVYGGSNTGKMGWHSDKYDVAGDKVEGVTTYVRVESNKVTVTDTLFGGCRMSDVEGLAYVDVRNTTAAGINYLYGGNDISGNITRNTRVDISGGTIHHIWGGSNGRYDFVPVGDNEYKVYPFGTLVTNDTLGNLITTAGMPNVDSSQVHIWGGRITHSVYAGGSMADCRATYLDIDDQHFAGDHPVTVAGSVYGGGEGYWQNLNADRRGNVTGSTDVHLRHAATITDAKAYGGGRGGNVRDAKITTYSTWEQPFKELYGGCWGSDVTGTARLEFEGVNLVTHLFGGNDFSGNVYKSIINVRSGRFKNIYGGGNGTYPASYYQTNHPDATNTDLGGSSDFANSYVNGLNVTYNLTKPNSEYIELNFYDGVVDSCIYGGGKLGTVMLYKRTADGNYDLASRYTGSDPAILAQYPKVLKVPDITRTWDLTSADSAYKSPLKYSYILFNMHGGTVGKNIFAGGCGDFTDETRTAIVYGLKNLNMDGGYVNESVYGGSEFVNDGYAAECTDHKTDGVFDQTTMRPSSIVNVTGGTINGFLYGAGYLGDVYGSTYINVGKRAIDTCLAYRRTYAGRPKAYEIFKPGVSRATTMVPTMTDANDLYINHSVYAGANWGNNTGNTDFTKESYHGGESRVIVDGYGYNTSNSESSTQAAMNIRKSILGSGTSAEGGDIVSDVILRDYGAIDQCVTTKQLESIQRADSLLFHRSAVELIGATDATRAFVSEEYSIKNINVLNFRGYNVVQCDASVDEVGKMNVYEEDRNASGNFVLTQLSDLNSNTASSDCDNICTKTALVDKTTHKNTLLILADGIDMNIYKGGNYGGVNGYSYVTSPAGYSSTVVGASSGVSSATYTGYGNNFDGFVGTCSSLNKYISLTDGTYSTNHGKNNGPGWVDEDPNAGDGYGAEHKFINYLSGEEPSIDGYRVWNVGTGIRKRQTTIHAHTDPIKLPLEDVDVKFNNASFGGVRELAIAQAYVTLPAAAGGSYYMFDGTLGFVLNGENAPLNLVDSVWLTSWTDDETNVVPTIIRTQHTNGTYTYEDDGTHGSWLTAPLADGTVKSGVDEIQNRPNNTFALVMVPDKNFTNTMPDNPILDENVSSSLVVSGNSYVNVGTKYCSPTVSDGDRLLPGMKFYMLYDPALNSSFLGSVKFRLKEYNSSYEEVGTVEIEVFISTIIEDFENIEDNVMAMFNNGRTNKFTRRIVLPAVMEERDLYVTDVTWVPTDGNGTELKPDTLGWETDRFYLMPSAPYVTQEIADVYPKERIEHAEHPNHYYAKTHNRFAMTIEPSEDLTSDINAVLGWNNIATNLINVYALANDTTAEGGTAPDKITKAWDTSLEPDAASQYVLHTEDDERYPNERGLHIGTLNGRGSVVLNVNLYYDGERIYDKVAGKGYVGKVVLGLKSYNKTEDKGRFTLTIYVKTRENGDTIYVASESEYVERDGVKVYPFEKSYKYYHADTDRKPLLLGKSPNCYVHNFQQALSSTVYQEGDVIAILDNVTISGGANVYIQGADGPPIEVMRYDGHHHEFPGEGCVYRGPMITVDGSSTFFSAKNIYFHGSAGAKVKQWTSETANRTYYDGVDGRALIWADNAQTQRVPYGISGTLFANPVPDTNAAFGPIIQAKNGATVSLSDGTVVIHNWNAYGSVSGQHVSIYGDDMPNDSTMLGAISLTGGSTLKLSNDVTIEQNMCHTFAIDDRDNLYGTSGYNKIRPANGAVYINGGKLVLEDSKDMTAINIKDNYLMDPYIHGTVEQQAIARWWTYYPDANNPATATRWILKPQSFFNDWPRANVYLTRKPVAVSSKTVTYTELKDNQSDRIIVSGNQSAQSSIGVRKWFPGLTTRDTINFATYGSGDNSMLADAVGNNIFTSDDDQRIFYSAKVNNSLAYLVRCVSFQHQYYLAGAHATEVIGPLDTIDISADDGLQQFTASKIKSGSPLEFKYFENSCPHGGDTIIYRVQGGFAPYTYTWSDPGADNTPGNADDKVMKSYTTTYTNSEIQGDLKDRTLTSEDARLAKYLASVADTIYLPYEQMEHTDATVNHKIRVSAVDVSGQCELHKDIDITIDRHWDELANDMKVTYIASTSTAEQRANLANWTNVPSDGWTDTARAKTAYVHRNYKSIKVDPKVWVNRNAGVITAVVAGEGVNDHVYEYIDEDNNHELSTLYFCDGDVVTLQARSPYTEVTPNTHFVMWDFDPYYRNTAVYVVPAATTSVTAYFGPNAYWKDHINTPALGGVVYDENFDYDHANPPEGAKFVVTYHGDVHIYDEAGLAWLISSVNGLNGTQARTYRYNKVYLHQKSNGQPYDMKDYLWTPMGTLQHPFRGWLRGAAYNDTALVAGDNKVVIKNIILNEPERDYVGMFGILDTAKVTGIKISGAMVRGSQYVGTLAGKAMESRVQNVTVADDELGTVYHGTAPILYTVLASHYASGGLIGWGVNSKVAGPVLSIGSGDDIVHDSIFAKFIGDAVYNGGVVGFGSTTDIDNQVVYTDNRLNGLYLGGIVGSSNAAMGPSQGLFGLFGRKSGNPSHIANNYVRINSTKGGAQRVGGIAGYAENTVIENNYVYGELAGTVTDGAVAAVAAQGANADRNYYAEGSTDKVVGLNNGGNMGDAASFTGSGNAVHLEHQVAGMDNLTRALNLWVREQNAIEGITRYSTWRSDLEGVNSGYPIFGEPDMIPVRDSLTVEDCEQVEWHGMVFTTDTTLSYSVVDSILMVDSTLHLNVIIHHGTETNYTDSATVAEGYDGYGFSVSPAEAAMLREAIDSIGYATLVLSDTLVGEYGCDSVITLTLTFTAGQGVMNVSSRTDIRLYPNPTLSVVNVEAEAMSRLELYDNEGRRLADFTAEGDKISIDLTGYSTGVYYIRIHTPSGVTIQKVIKK